MHLIRVGYRTINLEYLIETADSVLGAPSDEAPPGGIRVSIYPGKTFDVGGPAAVELRVHLDDNLKSLPGDNGAAQPSRPSKRGRSRSIATAEPSSSRPQEE